MAKCSKEEIEATGETSIETTAIIKKIVKPPMKDRIIADPTDAITRAAQEETGKKILKIWKTSKTMGTKARTVELMISKRIRLCQLTIFT
jgi:hypothetical protein